MNVLVTYCCGTTAYPDTIEAPPYGSSAVAWGVCRGCWYAAELFEDGEHWPWRKDELCMVRT